MRPEQNNGYREKRKKISPERVIYLQQLLGQPKRRKVIYKERTYNPLPVPPHKEIPVYDEQTLQRARLSPKEKKVYELRRAGLTRQQVASELDINPGAGSTHLAKALRKLRDTAKTTTIPSVEEQAPLTATEKPRTDIQAYIKAARESGIPIPQIRKGDSEAYLRELVASTAKPRREVVMTRVRRKEKARDLTYKEREQILTLMAQGRKVHTIARQLKCSERDISNFFTELREERGVDTMKEVILEAIDNGEIRSEKIYTRIDLTKFEELDAKQRLLLDLYIEDNGRNKTEEIAQRMGFEHIRSVWDLFSEIKHTVNIYSPIQLAAVYKIKLQNDTKM